jgi:hypothetical protein
MIEKKTIPVAPFKGLYLDGVTVPGGLSKAENVVILQDGTAERRLFERTLADSEACLASRGTKEVYELLKNDGTRYIFADIDESSTYTSAFAAEEITHFSGWTATSGWTYGSSKWTHGAGTTALVATSEVAVVAATLYRVVVNVTAPEKTVSGTNWAYTHTDSTFTWTTKTGSTEIVWLNKWTHSAGSTIALNCSLDFSVTAGASYVIKVHATHTSGTGCAVYIGGTLAGTIASTGTHTFIARFVSDATPLRFVPSSDWVGSLNKTLPDIPSKLDNWISCKKLVDPAGANLPSNYDYTAGTHGTDSKYDFGSELMLRQPYIWYGELASVVSQSLAVYLGSTLAGTITESGEYSYDVTTAESTPGAVALTFTPTTSWTGSVNSASVMKMTQAVAGTKTKVIGGTVTGTTDYETTWGNLLTDLTSGDAIHPQWTTLQDRAFRVDGTNKNYWFEDATYYHTPGVPSPSLAPVTASTTGGSLVAGDYNVWYTYVKRYSNNYVVEGNPSPASAVTVAGTAITVSLIACTEDDVNYIRVYRTIYNEMGGKGYREMEVPNATGTVTLILHDDDIRDSTLELEYNHDMPPIAKFALGAGSRLWLIDNNGALHWSILDQPEVMPADNMTTFDPKDGDKVTGMCPLRKHILFFKRNKTWLIDMFSETVDEDGTPALSKDVVSSNIGCIATGSIQSVGTDSAIWLSHAGFILYNGGTIKNISAGDAASGTPSRIQSVINSYLSDGAENFIDSAYHSARQLYHVNLLTRNAGGTAITGQRHFVYNMVSDSWTEYVYRNSSNVRMYETNFAMGHDSLGNEVILIPFVATTAGLVIQVYQGEYGEPPDSQYATTELLDSTGAGGVALDKPRYSFCDSSDNVYVVSDGCDVFKITPAVVKTNITSEALILTHLFGSSAGYNIDVFYGAFEDTANTCVYLQFHVITSDPEYYVGVKVTFAGVVSTVYQQGAGSGTRYNFVGLNSTGTIMYAMGTGTTQDVLYSITGPGVANTVATVHDFATYVSGSNYWSYGPYAINSDDMYYFSVSNAGGNYYLGILSDIDGTPVSELHDTGISSATYTAGRMIVVSSSKVILTAVNGSSETVVFEGVLGSTTWEFSVVVAAYGANSFTDYRQVTVDSDGAYALGGHGGNYVNLYSTDWMQTGDIVLATADDVCGASHLLSTTEKEKTIIMCGYATDNVYKVEPVTMVIGDDEPTMKNTIAHIVSNVNDLGMSQDKRISRAYLDMDCKYPGCGSFSLEPSYEVNYYTHAIGEVAQPSGSVSMRPWQHPGHKTWVYTNSAFDSDVEQWLPLRLDVGTKGNKFRYAIRAGDVATNVTGQMLIKPPRLEVQILGKGGKDD